MISYKFFTTDRCHRCPAVKEFLVGRKDIKGEIIDAGETVGLEEARRLEVQQVPTVVFYKDDAEMGRAYSVLEVEELVGGN